MNFFEHQHQARRNTKWLVLFFILAVIAIIAAVCVLVTAVYVYYLMGEAAHYTEPQPFYVVCLDLLWYVAPSVGLVIALVSASRISSLSGNGSKVASYIGAIPLDFHTDNLKEKQLRNVVEEMAIASGVPVPDIYVLRGEHGINAFAAGMDPSSSVVGVTDGAIETLTRDEMQGVIAHEFSHVFNGDSRLNVNLMGWLAGIMFLATAGQVILRGTGRRRSSSSKNDGAAAILILGAGLLAIGYIGVFFARLIKSAVSRQREYLADASAVQFTRNPNGLAGALQKIKEGSSRVQAGESEEASHFFFGSIKYFALFATHPPVDERLKRIGQLHIEVSKPRPPSPTAKESARTVMGRVGQPNARDLIFAAGVVGAVTGEQRKHLDDPMLAMQFVIGLLAADSGNQKVLNQVLVEIRNVAMNVAPERRLQMIELALPALRRLPKAKVVEMLNALEALIVSDQKIQPFEIAVLTLLRRHLDKSSKAVRQLSLKSLKVDALRVFAMVAENESAFLEGVRLLAKDNREAGEIWKSRGKDPLEVERSLRRLGSAEPLAKEIIFSSLLAVVSHDQVTTLGESHWVRAVSEAMEIPLPATA